MKIQQGLPHPGLVSMHRLDRAVALGDDPVLVFRR
jgi:hypothetical protein